MTGGRSLSKEVGKFKPTKISDASPKMIRAFCQSLESLNETKNNIKAAPNGAKKAEQEMALIKSELFQSSPT